MEKSALKVWVVAGVILKKDDKFLLVQEGDGPVKGLWNWPAGKVDEGESIEQAAIREAKEEAGYDIELKQKIGIFHETPTEAVKHLFEAKILGGELKYPEDEIMDAKWYTFEEIEKLEGLRNPWIIKGLKILQGK